MMLVMSDIHFRDKAPVWRSPEPNWQDYMGSMFVEINELADKLCSHGNDRMLLAIAGDLFDRWDVSFETFRTAVSCFSDLLYAKQMFAVPGQHDLPNHSYEQKRRSAFGMLDVAFTKAYYRDVHNRTFIDDGDRFDLYGVGWEGELNTNQFQYDSDRAIVLLHRYVWMDGCSYPGATKTDGCAAVAKELKRPQLIISGDNHIGFWDGKYRVFNCGSLYRATRDQINYRPRIGIVTEKLDIIPYYLDTEFDKYLTEDNVAEVVDHKNDLEVDEFLQELRKMGRGGLDYLEAIKRFCLKENIDKEVRLLLREILEMSNGPAKKTRTARKR